MFKLIFACLLFITSATADVIPVDWETTGDGKISLDVTAKLEWLDLTETSGLSMTYVMDSLSSDFLGWRLPSEDEFQTLISHVFTSTYSAVESTFYGSDNEIYRWKDLFGLSDPTNNNRSYGWYYEGSTLRLGGIIENTVYHDFDEDYSMFESSGNNAAGVFLVRETSIPTPASYLLLLLVLSGLILRRKTQG